MCLLVDNTNQIPSINDLLRFRFAAHALFVNTPVPTRLRLKQAPVFTGNVHLISKSSQGSFYRGNLYLNYFSNRHYNLLYLQTGTITRTGYPIVNDLLCFRFEVNALFVNTPVQLAFGSNRHPYLLTICISLRKPRVCHITRCSPPVTG